MNISKVAGDRYIMIHLSEIIFLAIFLLRVECQSDLFELHDKERGRMDLHVTRDKVNIEATSDSVNMVMNPDDAPGGKRANGGRGMITRDNSSVGFTVGNIDQAGISLKENGKPIGNKTLIKENVEPIGSKRLIKEDGGKVEAVDDLVPSHSSVIHLDVLDNSVKRYKVPVNPFSRLLGKGPTFKTYNQTGTLNFESPRDETERKNTLFHDTKVRRLFQVPHDVNGYKREDENHIPRINDVKASKKSLNIRTFTLFQGPKKKFKILARDHRYKDVNGTRKSIVDMALSRQMDGNSNKGLYGNSNQNELRAKKRSGMKEMTLHNKLGGMRIKSDPQGTSVISESGNIDITMVNDHSTSQKVTKKDTRTSSMPLTSRGVVSTGMHAITESEAYDINNDERSLGKGRIHLADYTGLKKSKVTAQSSDV